MQNPAELVVASSGKVSVAPVGTALPISPTVALNAAFVDLGYITEDGASVTVTPEIEDFRAWQSRSPIRRELISQDVAIGFALQQWNAESVPLAFGGGAVTSPAAGVFRYDLPEAADALDERAMVIDAIDGGRHLRFVIPRGNVTDAVETTFVRNSLALLPISFAALEPVGGGSPMYFLADDEEAFGEDEEG